MSLTHYHFLPTVRQGLTTRITQSGEDAHRAQVNVRLTFDAKRKDGSDPDLDRPPMPASLYGPGDILGFDRRVVVRTDPRPDVGDFEDNYFPAIEFADADFAWRFTARSAREENPQLEPWITLVALVAESSEGADQEFVDGERPESNLPPNIVVSTKALPPLLHAWRWAHVQITAEQEADLPQILRDQPERAVCRLLCPRRLYPNTRYAALVVPTFQLGVMAGLGLDLPKEVKALDPAWEEGENGSLPYLVGSKADLPEDLQDKECIRLPYYYRWEFGTGPGGDFEHLVRLLEPRVISGLGVRDIDCSAPGYGVRGVERQGLAPPEERYLKMEGALQSIDTSYTRWGRDPADQPAGPPEPLQHDLADLTYNPEAQRVWVRFTDELLDPTMVIVEVSEPLLGTIEDSGKDWDIVLTWRTSEECKASIAYGGSAGGIQISLESDRLTKIHRFKLEGLKPSPACPFTISVTLQDGQEASTGECTFSVPPLPTVVPPIYGRWHAGRKSVDEMTQDAWIDVLNLDPRHRSAAGVGAEVIRTEQEQLMASAWDQLGPIEEVNDALRRAQLGREASAALEKRLDELDDEWYVQVTAPMQRHVLGKDLDLREQSMEDVFKKRAALPSAYVDPAYRHLSRPRGAFRRRHERSSQDGEDPTPKEENAGPDSAPGPPLGTIRLRDLSFEVVPETLPRIQVAEHRLYFGWLEVGDEPRSRGLHINNIGSSTLKVQEVTYETTRGSGYSCTCGDKRVPITPAEKREADEEKATIVNKADRQFVEMPLKVEPVDDRPLELAVIFTASHKGGYGGCLRIDCSDPATPVVRVGLTALVGKREGTKGEAPEDPHRPQTLPTVLGAGDEISAEPTWFTPNMLKEGISPALRPSSTAVERVKHNLTLRGDLARRFEKDATGDLLEPVLWAPEFSDPMYEYLNDQSEDLLLPGVEKIPQNTVGLLQANRRFIESYLCGLNHEFAAELLWQGYPTDQRGTYFRQFWDVSEYIPGPTELDDFLAEWLRDHGHDSVEAMPEPEKQRWLQRFEDEVGDGAGLSDDKCIALLIQQDCLEEKLRDIQPLVTWRDRRLGHNQVRPGASLIFAIRGALLWRYPQTLIYAVDAVPDPDNEGKRVPALPEYAGEAEATPQFPTFGASLSSDLIFLGFPFGKDEARGGDGNGLGKFIVIEERVGEPRFGLDKASGEYKTWYDLSWEHFKLPDEFGNYLDEATLPPKTPDDEKRDWKEESSSAERAFFTMQMPVRVAVHAEQMLPPLPSITGIQPDSAPQDSTLRATITGQYLGGVMQASVSGSGVKARVLEGSTDSQVPVGLSIAWWAQTGPRSLVVDTVVGRAESPEDMTFLVQGTPALNVKEVEAAGERTVRLVLDRRPERLKERLTNVGPYAVVSPLALEDPDGAAGYLVGTGPYRFETWIRGLKLVLTRNEDYRGGAPEIPRLEFLFVGYHALLQMLSLGELDMCDTRDEAMAETAATFGLYVTRFETFYRDQNVFLISSREIAGDFCSPGGVHLERARGVEVLRYGCQREPTTFDPLVMQDSASLKIAAQVLEGLTAWQPGRDTPVLGLADNVEMSAEGPEWTVSLREGIRFHDGAVLDAEAVVANLVRHLT